jgi:hypothetical protein
MANPSSRGTWGEYFGDGLESWRRFYQSISPCQMEHLLNIGKSIAFSPE